MDWRDISFALAYELLCYYRHYTPDRLSLSPQPLSIFILHTGNFISYQQSIPISFVE